MDGGVIFDTFANNYYGIDDATRNYFRSIYAGGCSDARLLSAFLQPMPPAMILSYSHFRITGLFGCTTQEGPVCLWRGRRWKWIFVRSPRQQRKKGETASLKAFSFSAPLLLQHTCRPEGCAAAGFSGFFLSFADTLGGEDASPWPMREYASRERGKKEVSEVHLSSTTILSYLHTSGCGGCIRKDFQGRGGKGFLGRKGEGGKVGCNFIPLALLFFTCTHVIAGQGRDVSE